MPCGHCSSESMRILHFCCCMCHAIPLIHILLYAIRSGLSPTTAASILSAIGVSSFLGRIMWGFWPIVGGPMRPMCWLSSSRVS